MEGKLIKMVEGYTLSLTDSIDDLYGISDKQLADDHQLQKLSLKNCEAVANGYDLDELASSLVDRETTASVDSPYRKTLEKYVKIGLQKALEISANKKFTENQVRMAIEIAWRNDIENTKIDIIESIKQKEFDVDICCYVANENDELDTFNSRFKTSTGVPKTDADGCLILRRKI